MSDPTGSLLKDRARSGLKCLKMQLPPNHLKVTVGQGQVANVGCVTLRQETNISPFICKGNGLSVYNQYFVYFDVIMTNYVCVLNKGGRSVIG